MDSSPITASSLRPFFHIKASEFERAYKDHLSGFRSWVHAGHADEWLIFPENAGEFLSLDETALTDGEVYTILSNKEAHGRNGSLVAIVKGTLAENVSDKLKNIPAELREAVREITLDLADNMRAIARECFPNAIITLDRFHVQKDCFEALQHLRVTLKNKSRREDSKARRKHANELRRRKSRRKDPTSRDPRGRKGKRLNEQYVPERLENGDTRVELLTRCRCLLSVSGEKWSESQKVRARILFREYPELREAYSVCHSLRAIYNGMDTTRDAGRAALAKWYGKALALEGVFDAVVDTIKTREDDVVNYFVARSTNASAESLNSKIKRFRAALHGVVDVKFFLFRLSKIFG